MVGNFLNSKANLDTSTVFTLVFLVLCLLILLAFVYSYYSHSQDIADVLACQESLEQMTLSYTRPTFFDDFRLSSKGVDLIETTCPSHTIYLEKNVQDLVSEIETCWRKFLFGQNILPSSSSGEVLCVQCGLLIAKEEIPEFHSELRKELSSEVIEKSLKKNSSDVANLNYPLYYSDEDLSWVPSSLDANKKYGIYFVSGRGDLSCITDFEFSGCFSLAFDGVVEGLASSSALFSFLESFLGPSTDTFSGVIFQELLDSDDQFNSESLSFESQDGAKITCTQIINPPFRES